MYTHRNVSKLYKFLYPPHLRIRKYERVSNKLEELHWPNMRSRMAVQALTLQYKIIITKQPNYLLEKCRSIRIRKTALCT